MKYLCALITFCAFSSIFLHIMHSSTPMLQVCYGILGLTLATFFTWLVMQVPTK